MAALHCILWDFIIFAGMKPRLSIWVFVLLLALAACNKSTVPTPQEDVLYQLEGYFGQKPDSALKILDTLNISALSEKEWAHYCLLKTKVRDAFFLYDEETDSLLTVAENYFIDGKDKWFEAQTCEALSRIAFKEGKGEQIKLDWLLKASQSMEKCKQVDERLVLYSSKQETGQDLIDGYKNKIQMRLGMCYLDNGYTEEGLRFLKPVDLYFAEGQNFGSRFASAFMLGNAYLALKEYDSCRMCYENGLDAARQLGQTENIAYYHYSMSMLYLHQFDNQDDEGEQGRQLLQEAVSECHQGLLLYKEPMFRFKEGLYCNLAKSYYRLEQYDSCAYYAERWLDFMNTRHFEIVPQVENASVFYNLYKSYESLGNSKKALEFASRYIEMQQTLESQPKAVEQVKSDYDKKLALMQLQHEQQVKRYRLYLILAMTLLALVGVLWLSNRYRKNKEIEALRQEEAYRKLQSEFETASQQAQQAQQALQQRVMARYKTGKDDRLEHIMAEFATSYPSATEKLKSTYPNLTESERNIIILSFLGFRMKEEAELLNLSLNTVEKYRTNIRKKVGSNPISDLIR